MPKHNIAPCPHCGGIPSIAVGVTQTIHSLLCPPGSSCIGSGMMLVWFPEETSDEKAIAWWNHRAGVPE